MVCHRSCQSHVQTPCLLSNVERSNKDLLLLLHDLSIHFSSFRSNAFSRSIHRSCKSHLLSSVPLQPFSQLPKPGGMGKGWDRYYLFNLGTKLLFYPINVSKGKKPTSANEPAIILDMTSEAFEVSSVRSPDIYHADKRDVTSIFKVEYLLLRL